MLILQNFVWNRISANRDKGQTTRYYIDEFHILLKEPQTAAYFIGIWKRCRKWGCVATGITQNVKDLLTSPEIQNIFDNTDFFLMLNQANADREILGEKLGLSREEMRYAAEQHVRRRGDMSDQRISQTLLWQAGRDKAAWA